MAKYSFSYRGYEVWLAAFQPSKQARGGHTRSLQIRKDSRVRKSVRYDTQDVYAFGKASKKATAWIDRQLDAEELTVGVVRSGPKEKRERDPEAREVNPAMVPFASTPRKPRNR